MHIKGEEKTSFHKITWDGFTRRAGWRHKWEVAFFHEPIQEIKGEEDVILTKIPSNFELPQKGVARTKRGAQKQIRLAIQKELQNSK